MLSTHINTLIIWLYFGGTHASTKHFRGINNIGLKWDLISHHFCGGKSPHDWISLWEFQWTDVFHTHMPDLMCSVNYLLSKKYTLSQRQKERAEHCIRLLSLSQHFQPMVRNISENSLFLWEFTGMMRLEEKNLEVSPVRDTRYPQMTKEAVHAHLTLHVLHSHNDIHSDEAASHISAVNA